jgi:hypothetical protein
MSRSLVTIQCCAIVTLCGVIAILLYSREYNVLPVPQLSESSHKDEHLSVEDRFFSARAVSEDFDPVRPSSAKARAKARARFRASTGRGGDDDASARTQKWNQNEKQEDFPARLPPQSKSNKQILKGGLEWWLQRSTQKAVGTKWTGDSTMVWPAVAHVHTGSGTKVTPPILAKGWQFNFEDMQPRTAQFLQESSAFLLSRLLPDHTPDTAVAKTSSCSGSDAVVQKVSVRLVDDTPHGDLLWFPSQPQSASSAAPSSSVARAFEGYELSTERGAVVLTGATVYGAVHGIVSLLQMLQPHREGCSYIPAPPADVKSATAGAPKPASSTLYMRDYPEYAYRGLLLDTSAVFVDMEQLQQVLLMMACLKVSPFALLPSRQESSYPLTLLPLAVPVDLHTSHYSNCVIFLSLQNASSTCSTGVSPGMQPSVSVWTLATPLQPQHRLRTRVGCWTARGAHQERRYCTVTPRRTCSRRWRLLHCWACMSCRRFLCLAMREAGQRRTPRS